MKGYSPIDNHIAQLSDIWCCLPWTDNYFCFGLIYLMFQLFEMGLELSFARLKALAKFAFGMGLTQVGCFQKPQRSYR